MLLAKEWPTRPVHIVLRTPEIIDRNHNPGSKRLIFPTTRVITQTPNRPQQKRRSHNMKQTEQPHKQGQMRIKHVFSAADKMGAAKNRPNQIDGIEGLKKQKPTSLPRKKQRTLQPKRRRNEKISQITEVEEVLQPILMPVNRHPSEHPQAPANLKPKRHTHARNCTRPEQTDTLDHAGHGPGRASRAPGAFPAPEPRPRAVGF